MDVLVFPEVVLALWNQVLVFAHWFDKHLHKYLQKYLVMYFVISKVILTFKFFSIIIKNSFPARNVSRDIPAPKIPIDFLGARYNEAVQVEVNRRELMKI